MSGLRLPLKNALRKTTTPSSVRSMWHRIDARGRTRSHAPSVRSKLVSLTAVVAVGFVVAVAWSKTASQWARSPSVEALARPPATVPVGPKAAKTLAPSSTEETTASLASPDEAAQAPSQKAVAAAPGSSSAMSSVASPSPRESWRRFAAEGKNDQAYAMLGRAGIATESESAPVADLFALADVARLSGHPADAIDPLQRIVADHSTDSRAPLAALTLGRVRLRSLGMPAAAAQSLEKAIALGVPLQLAEETHALLIESLSRMGDRERARAEYNRFSVRFPSSTRSADLQKWVSDR
jgi:transmembrane sensor